MFSSRTCAKIKHHENLWHRLCMINNCRVAWVILSLFYATKSPQSFVNEKKYFSVKLFFFLNCENNNKGFKMDSDEYDDE